MTISSVFIRRPRLAFVISTVITIAGLIALSALPVAQFPDIVPPQVTVTTVYPGASAEEVERNGVTTKKQSSALLQVVAFFSPKGTRDVLFLSNFVTINILDSVKRVPGVGDASLFGALDYSMRIWLKLDRMSSLDITPNDVVKAVQAQNTRAAVGRVGAAPLMGHVDFQLNISTQGRLTDTKEFENIVVRALPDGSLVRVKDIGRVELGAKT